MDVSSVSKKVAIVGAGIVGVSAAIWLQRAGHDVVLIDREGPASGTSHGNAGLLAASAIIPVTVPGLWKKAPRMVLDPAEPLYLRWSYLPKLIPFLLRYMANARAERVQHIATALDSLLADCAGQHTAIAKGTPAEKYVKEGDYLIGYGDKKGFEGDAFSWNLRRQLGHEFHEMSGEEIGEFDPLLAGKIGYGVRCPHHGHITDPGAYVKALADHVVANGGELRICEVSDLHVVDGRATGVVTNKGAMIEADEMVIATGVWSSPLAEQLGIKVPMEAERGYHVEFVNPSVMPKLPMMVSSGKFVMTPMEGRLRCAGIVEFGGLSKEKSRAPLELLKRRTKELLPELQYDDVVEWVGYRPSTSDSLPLIGKTNLANNVWLGFGHQHIGLSGGPKTGLWLSEMISGNRPNVDLSPFDPARFA